MTCKACHNYNKCKARIREFVRSNKLWNVKILKTEKQKY